jgi:hypothetical protein
LRLQPQGNPIPLSFSYAAGYAAVERQRPIIDVEIAARSPAGRLLGEPISTTMLVDSGADISMIDEAYAAVLGIVLDELPPATVGGIGGEVPARQGVLMMDLCGRWIPVPVFFCEYQRTGLLGRAGAFDSMWLTFAHRDRIMLGEGV